MLRMHVSILHISILYTHLRMHTSLVYRCRFFMVLARRPLVALDLTRGLSSTGFHCVPDVTHVVYGRSAIRLS